MRNQVIAALESMSDRRHQETRWGRVEEGVNYYDDLTLNVHILYDDTEVLPKPQAAVPDILFDSEVPAFQFMADALTPMLNDLGRRPDGDYMADPRWPGVIDAARSALSAMRLSDEGPDT